MQSKIPLLHNFFCKNILHLRLYNEIVSKHVDISYIFTTLIQYIFIDISIAISIYEILCNMILKMCIFRIKASSTTLMLGIHCVFYVNLIKRNKYSFQDGYIIPKIRNEFYLSYVCLRIRSSLTSILP